MPTRTLFTTTGGAILYNQTLPNHPHKFDVFVPNGAINQALVVLHGGGNAKEVLSRQIGLTTRLPLNPRYTRWAILQAYNCVVIIPQGQICSGITNAFNPNGADTRTPANPEGVPTWSADDFWSQHDDKAFLTDLAIWTMAQYGVAGVNLAGHSLGGIMVSKMWQEASYANTSWRRFISLAGPRAVDTALVPVTASPSDPPRRPFLQQYGALDENLQIFNGIAGPGDHFQDDIWFSSTLSVAAVRWPGLPRRFGAFKDLQNIVNAYNTRNSLAPETVTFGAGVLTAASLGTKRTWTYSSSKIVLELFSAGAHSPSSIAKAQGLRIIRRWLDWMNATPI